MNKGFFATLLLSAVLAACGDTGTGTGDTAATSSTAGNQSALYREGRDYERLAEPVAAADNEVVEVFSYACPACAQFQPEVDAWKSRRGNVVILRYVPAQFHAAWLPFAQAYHAAQEMGILGRVHRVLFDALHRQRVQATSIEQIADILANAGIDRAKFLEIAQSPAVAAALASSGEYVQKAGVGSTPTLVVAGRYRIARTRQGSPTPLEIADWLIENKP
jgi:thiol:disulfide interchange protein DsbA